MAASSQSNSDALNRAAMTSRTAFSARWLERRRGQRHALRGGRSDERLSGDDQVHDGRRAAEAV